MVKKMNLANKSFIDTLETLCDDLGSKDKINSILSSDIEVKSYFMALKRLGLNIKFILTILSEIVCAYEFTQEEFGYFYKRLRLCYDYTKSEYTSTALDIMLQLADRNMTDKIATLNSCYMNLDSEIDLIDTKDGQRFIIVRTSKGIKIFLDTDELKKIEDRLYCIVIDDDGIEIIGEDDKEKATREKLKIFIKEKD